MASDPDKIRIIADDDNADLDIKGALPGIDELSARVHEVSSEVLQKNLASLMQRVEAMVASSTASLKQLSVKEVKVSVAVDGTGEFSLPARASADALVTSMLRICHKRRGGILA